MKKAIFVVLGAWAAGAGSMLLFMTSGCIGSAKADTPEGSIAMVPCTVQGTANGKPATFAVLSLPGRAKEDLAVNVVRLQGSPTSSAAATIPGGSFYNVTDIVSNEPPLVSDGAVAVECISGTGTVNFFVR